MNGTRVPIEGFENYEVNRYGEVVNTDSGRIMKWSPTMDGDMTVGMVKDGHQYRRSVKGLVANAFVLGRSELFNTPVLLDGNKNNVCVENLVWRPRWFAWHYTHQFTKPQAWYYSGPIVELISLKEYESYFHAAVSNGILCVDIRKSIYNDLTVFPTGQQFAFQN